MAMPAALGAGPQVPSGTQSQKTQRPTDGYFANLKADRVIAELRPREKNCWNARQNRGLPTLWRLSYAQACGMDPNTARNATQRLEFCGTQAQYIRFRVQMTRAHVKQRNQLAQGQRPSFNAVATNDDAASLAQVPIAGKVITYIFREANGERKCVDALEGDGYFGEGFIWMRWDADAGDIEDSVQMVPANDQFTGQPLLELNGQPVMKPQKVSKPVGAPSYTAVFPWNEFSDPNVIDPPWRVVREKASKWELIASYPDAAERLQAMSLNRENEPGITELFQWDLTSATDDTLVVKHFYHKPCKAVPGGRYIGYVDDVVLWDTACPLAKRIPLVSICSARYFDTPFGYPEACDLLSLQEMIDELLSQAATNILKFGNQNIWGEDGVEFDPQKFMQGGAYFTLKQNQKAPQVIQWAQLPDAVKYLLEYLPARMAEISGMNSVVRGEPDANITSGVFASLMQSIAEKFINSTQAAYDFALNEIGNMTLEMVRSNTDTRFAAMVSGEGLVPYMKYFTAQDFATTQRVEVQRQSPVMNSIGGRFEVFDRTVKLPRDERQAAVQMLMTGDSSAWTENDMSCLILIRKENELLSRGQQVEVSKTDDHMLHAQKHRASLDRLRTQDPPQDPQEFAQWRAAIQAHIDHIGQHPVVWAQTNPVYAAVCGLPPPPVFDPMSGGFVPHPGAAPGPQGQPPQGQPPGQPAGPPGARAQGAPKPAPQLPAQPQPAGAQGRQTNGQGPQQPAGNTGGSP